MPIDASPAGTLDIENATLRSREIVALTNMVAGNDVVRSGGPALEVYGDPSNGGNEATLQLVSNTANTISTSFTSLTSNAGVLSVKTGTDASDNGTITFGGFSNERLRITSDGKVGVGTDDPQYTLDVGGKLAQDGQKIYPERRWEVDLSSGTSTSNFYPLYLATDPYDANIGPYMFPVTFNVIGESLAGNDLYNEETLVGYARGGGSTDHQGMCKVHSRRYEGDEFKCLGIWEGTANQLGIVIYLRGGYKYSLITNATDVVVNTSSYGINNSIWAVKNVSKTDVVGTSLNINELQDVGSFVQMSEVTSFTGSLILPQNFQRLGIGTVNPGAPLNIHDATSMTQSSEVLRLSRGSNGDDIRSASSGTIGMYLQDTATPYQVARLSWQHDGSDGSTEGLGRLGFWTSASSGGVPTERMTINKDGNVGIGVYPSAKLHVNGDMMRFNEWKTKTWYGGTSDNGTRYVDLITHNGGNSNSGVMVGNIEVMISRGGYAQQRAYARFHINYSYYGAAWRGHTSTLDMNLSTQVSSISISLSTSPAKIRLAITSPNTGGTTGQYYVKFDGPVYVSS